MYVGPTSRVERQGNCLVDGRIVRKTVCQSEAQEQLFKEIIGNAADNVLRSRKKGVDPFKIQVTTDDEWVTVKNYGDTIPVVVDDKTGLWTPELIFGHMLTSSNFGDRKDRLYIGKNGIGAKATNILSSEFEVVCADTAHRKIYRQTWRDNMSRCDTPRIRKMPASTKRGYTQVRYKLDVARFGVERLDDEASQMIGAHCAALSFVCDVPVAFNGTTFKLRTVKAYASLFLDRDTPSFVYSDDHTTCCVADTPNAGVQFSFVNGMITERGGVHVNAVYKALVKGLAAKFKSEYRLTKRDVESHVSVFVSCRLKQPEFDGQTKNYLKRPEPSLVVPARKIAAMTKWGIAGAIKVTLDKKSAAAVDKSVSKNAAKKRAKVEQAAFAGTAKRAQTSIIVTEGLSAKTWAVKYSGFVPNGKGRDIYGILPLRGVLPNALSFSTERLFENAEVQAMVSSIGCKVGVDYTDAANRKKLRYHSLLMIRDPDTDGAHILALLLLVFMTYFPSLVEIGFVKFMRVPVVRCKVNGANASFYTLNAFKRGTDGKRVKDVEYFKGLGTSEDHHIKEDFDDPNIVTFVKDRDAIERTQLAFNAKRSNERKAWIEAFSRENIPDVSREPEIAVSRFIDHELIDFSVDHIIRAIPESLDGFKESQRKALFAGFAKLKSARKVKVEQLANYAAEITAYKHGATCLAGTITNLAQDYAGSNNLPVFAGLGQFGTRAEGGKDASSGRYIHVALPDWIHYVYRPEDKCLETLITDEGTTEECETFYPIVPMHVINGACGIGTGYSTTIPGHNPRDVIAWLRKRLCGETLPELVPWYRGYTGEFVKGNDGFVTTGRATPQRNGSILIDELPITTWISHYRTDVLEKLVEQRVIDRYDNHSTEKNVSYTVHGYKGNDPIKDLKLSAKVSTANMTVITRTENRGISTTIFRSVSDLLERYYEERFAAYQERRASYVRVLQDDMRALSERQRYICAVLDRTIAVSNAAIDNVFAAMDALSLDHKWLDKVKTRELTADGAGKLQREIDDKRREIEHCLATSASDLWLRELDELDAVLPE